VTPPSQLDLFGEAQPSLEDLLPSGFDRPPPDFVERVRAELTATLRTVRGADRLPWPDLTRTTLAELRFNSIAGWLPPEEARALRAAFKAEMARLYDAEDERAGAAASSS
jgi:hypothetical protein